MLSSVLRSPRAIAVNIEIMRAFVEMRPSWTRLNDWHVSWIRLSHHERVTSGASDIGRGRDLPKTEKFGLVSISVIDVCFMLTFVETKLFTKLISDYMSDEEYLGLQNALVANPEAGDLIRGSGGVRKLRWSLTGRGKRGGIRVIYYLRTQQGQIWMLTAYAKNVAETIPAGVLKKIKEEIDG